MKGPFLLIALGTLNALAKPLENVPNRPLHLQKSAMRTDALHLSATKNNREAKSPDANTPAATLPFGTTNNGDTHSDRPDPKPSGIRTRSSDSARNNSVVPVPIRFEYLKGWHFDLWHGWMDAPYARSQLKSLWQTGALGEAYLVGRYPAALGIRLGWYNNMWSRGLQLGYRKHFTRHYQVAELLDERHYTSATVQAWTEKTYLKGIRWSVGGQFALGVGHQSIQIRAGPERGNTIQNTRLSGQITPLMIRIKHLQWGGFLGMGYGSAGILQTGLSYSPGR
jgi:hypothetical protein